MKSMTKRLLAALLAVAALFALVGCSKSDKADAAPKDYMFVNMCNLEVIQVEAHT